MNFGIIAAGEGSRLAQEGVETPKPLVRIDGTPMIERLLRIFERCGASRIAVIVNEEMKEVQEFLKNYTCSEGVELDVTIKSTPSSMHSMHELASRLSDHGKFIVTTVDTIFDENDFRRYAEAFREAPEDVNGMMAVTTHIDDEKPLYVATDKDMKITAFRDTPQGDERFISGGIYGLDEKAFPVLDRCIVEGQSRMRNFQRALVAAGLNLRAWDMGQVLDVDHASDIQKANDYLQAAKDRNY